MKTPIETAVEACAAGDFARVQEICDALLKADSANAQALYLLAETARRVGKHPIEIGYLRRLLRLVPDDPNVLTRYGHALAATGKLEPAMEAYRKAVEHHRTHADAFNGLGNVLLELGQFEGSFAAYNAAVLIAPDTAEFRYNRALLLLLLGRWAEAWPDFESRLDSPLFQPPAEIAAKPRWHGDAVEGKRILLYWEQGLGDSIQYVRYARVLADQGAHVIVQCQAQLRRLFANAEGVHELVSDDQPLPDFDLRAALPSLPSILRTMPDTMPVSGPYLGLDAQPNSRGQEAAPRVGVVWAGASRHANDLNRSCPFSVFRGLLAEPGVQYVSLQLGERADELRVAKGLAVEDLSPQLGDMLDTANAICGLDLVIAVDTAVAHLAGALGKPVWLLLPYVPDWRWLLGRTDTPWYPTMRLFRQPARGAWRELVGDVRAALRQEFLSPPRLQ